MKTIRYFLLGVSILRSAQAQPTRTPDLLQNLRFRNLGPAIAGVTGHAWGPNQDRGVFRTTDGGKTWQKTLYVDDTTGVSDMAIDPANPLVVYAGMWQVQRHPWEMISGGRASGIYRSLDGG